MIVVRFRVSCKPEKIDEALGLFREVVEPSRALPGTLHFDIGQDVVDRHSIIATEVFEDREALDRQESLPEVGNVMAAFEDFAAAAPEATIFEVASSHDHI
jgi:quinol monooxygenase YgiN